MKFIFLELLMYFLRIANKGHGVFPAPVPPIIGA